jgi:hypothetical protein
MHPLLKSSIEAHGGLARWSAFKALRARMTVRGAIFEVKRIGGFQEDVIYEISLREERVTIEGFGGRDRRLRFLPNLLVWETRGGTVLMSRNRARESFHGEDGGSAWDALHLGYFTSYAVWTYLNLPFLYAGAGFLVEEIEPWQEDGEEWRRLKASFPETVASHCREQITYFGPDGLMRRHDYTVDVLGGATGANYSSGYEEFQGIMMPTTRRVYAYDAKGSKVVEPLLVSIDIADIVFS